MATQNNFWPTWRGRALSADLALLVHTDAHLASSLRHLGAVAALARQGQRVMLAAPARHADLLARALGVWAIWPRADADDPADTPGALTATVGAQIDLAALPELIDRADGEAHRLAPRIHLPVPALQDLLDAWAAAGYLRSKSLLVGWCCTGANSAAMPDIAPDGEITLAAWSRPASQCLDLGPWPGDPAPNADPAAAPGWLQVAQQIALLDLLLTDDADAASLATALGKPVWWLDDTAPTSAALTNWAAAQTGALHGALRNLPGADAQAAMLELIAACQRGHTTAARAACVQLLISHPQRPDAWRLLGVLAQQAGELTLAGDCFERVTDLAPQYPDGWRSLGSSRARQGETGRACTALQRCIDLAPHDDVARTELAQALTQTGRRDEAIAIYRSGLQHQPAALDWHHRLGILLIEIEQPEAAADHFNQILASIDADHALHVPALQQLGRAMQAQGDVDAAAASYRSVMQAQPGHLEVACELSALYRQGRQTERAWALIEPLAAAHPHDPLLALEAIVLRRALCDWRAEPEPSHLRALAEAATTALDTQTLLRLAEHLDDPALAPLLAARAPNRKTSAPPPARARNKDRLRIGYAGSLAAVRSHGALLGALLEAHTRERFAVQVYQWNRTSATPNSDSADADGVATLDEVITLQGGSDAEIAERLRADRIDILIDLDGLGPQARPGIWSHRPASLQLAWLNQAGTTLPAGFDARLSDAASDGFIDLSAATVGEPGPAATQAPASTLWLPDGLMGALPFPALQLQATSAHRRRLRTTLGLPDKAPVLVSLAPHVRIGPDTWAIWMRLMATCPPAVLWLQEGLRSAQDRLRQAAVAAGIAPQRLVFADASRAAACGPAAQAIAAADLCLQSTVQLPDADGNDPIIDALCAAVPVLCVAGTDHTRRRSAALLHAAGQDRGVSADLAAHEALAKHLLRTPRELFAWRNELIQAHRQAPLFDVRRLTRQLESAWQTRWLAHVKHFTSSAR
jgi:predicted O-linked N-acetylglucosamine transferase (SPINDLY family)